MNKLFEYIPALEIYGRCFLHKFPSVKQKALALLHTKDSPAGAKTKENWAAVREYLEQLDIKEGDILLVHSSMDGLKPCDATALEIIKELEKITERGTLVFAAYPMCKYDSASGTYDYDPRRSPAWTGLLPNIFLREDHVVRSEFPLQTLAARGPQAEAMMKGNLDCVTAQGKGSAWEYLVNHDVKILYLGIEACQCCTMMNYPEDALGPDKWPIRDWYYPQTYCIHTADGVVQRKILHRDDELYRYYRMAYSERWLRNNGFLQAAQPGGVYVGFTPNGGELGRTLVKLAEQGRLLYWIPRRYWRVRRKGSGCF